MVLALWRLWIERGHPIEGRRWAEAVLELDGSEAQASRTVSRLPAHKRPFLIYITGILATVQGDYDGASELYEESLAAFRKLDYKKGMSGPLRDLGVVAYRQGDYERAVRLSEQALALAREFNTAFGVAYSLFTLADAVLALGDTGRAATLLGESLALFRGSEHTWGMAQTLTRLGSMACEAGEDTRASTLYGESLGLVRGMGLSSYAAVCLDGLARVAAMQDRPERAARLCAAAEAVREEISVPLSSPAHLPTARAERDRTVAAARAALGEDAFAAAWAEGGNMVLEQAAAYALGETAG